MTAKTLVEMYQQGAITAYQAMIDCLHMVDPKDPNLVLNDLSPRIRDEMLKYVLRYDSTRRSLGRDFGIDQVAAAKTWLESRSGQVDPAIFGR